MRYLVSLLLPLPFCCLLEAQPAVCTQDTVTGTYALVTQGTMLLPVAGQTSAVPAIALGLLSIDPDGTIAGQAVMSIGGDIIRSPWPGAIQVNADCTAAVVWAGGTAGTAVIQEEGREIRSIMTQSASGKGIVWGQWKRISRVPASVEPAQCSPASVYGVYAANYSGTQIGTPPGGTGVAAIPTVMIGLVSIDYKSQIDGGGTLSLGGDTLPFRYKGTVAVNPDCSAVTKMTTAAGPLTNDGTGWMVVLDGGNELWSLPTESNAGKSIVFGTWKRISPLLPGK